MIKVSGLSKSFGKQAVLQQISFEVPRGDVLALIGPSGAGKSTLLRCLNLLETSDTGLLRVGDLNIDCSQRVPSKTLQQLRQATAMVFQNYNLFKNKTALDNIALPLITAKGFSSTEARERAFQLLERVDLTKQASQYPATLSGGQQQRVGIARALALDPEVILFDEPTSSLDPERVAEVLSVIKSLAHRDITMIISTHEISFARQVANQILFMADGQIIERGQAKAVLDDASHERTRRFLQQLTPSIVIS
ncbi:amino acid ABC transporter ATP-binding protein [Iodobacter fluviatilis]|uniref:Amino acid ABC transporter ATP-binding protein (PAAT family) n=1 Tax=Iodobacter fluviatilis TaxID=537 RepID=A0A377Q556_9NEIS|nr:amino acid ABC transporter ATP-binding protein [Iodobacter fluviatilis]TCU82664.1 amino acid ABC transporter ATP-binding protein (PAAT family) [Iodobacter fluviatilis]STQ89850.1 Probable amino-acid import ATP-binding protein YxeO [Iodobacter fluviatilis]